MCELVNFILKCTGANFSVDHTDIKDIDHIPWRIEDLQDSHVNSGFSEYPLISKDKALRNFKSILVDFFSMLVESLHHSSVLYNDPALLENIHIWVATMTDSGDRAFRHTGAVFSLAMASEMCKVAQEVHATISTARKQLESEKKKKTVNKGRIGAIQSTVREGEAKLEMIDSYLLDVFDSVWIHRYRDVDPKIRLECVNALSQWAHNYRELFFDAHYLRYLGWMLSDASSQVRTTTVAQLRKIYESKLNVAAVRAFTERFRARMVEVAAGDADVAIRASAIELLDLVRDAGLLEPEDIDSVGRLIFDSESRVRHKAGRFFVANVEEVFESKTEEVAEDLNEFFGDEEEEDIESPKRSWIKFKSLVTMLQDYDSQEDHLQEKPNSAALGALSGAPVESRFVLATESVYPHLEELEQWRSLAGYLLYDHSQIDNTPVEDDAAETIKSLYKLEEGQEVILLEVLVCAVRLRIVEVAKSDIDKRGRKVKALTDKIPELQEEIAYNLAQIIPQLLNKFGAIPEAASVVLRLEHLVDLNIIQDLQKHATAYTLLLNDINKQFLTHSDQDVLAEASVALVHARSSDEMKEAMENKVQELWDDLVDALGTLTQSKSVKDGSSIPRRDLAELTNTVSRISHLAGIADCTNILETRPSPRSKKLKQNLEAPFNTLIRLTKRGLRDPEADVEIQSLEAELVVNSMKSLLLYFMWKVQTLTTALKSGKARFSTAYFEALAGGRELFIATLTATLQKQAVLDDTRFAALITLLDVQTLFGTLRHVGSSAKDSSEVDEDALLQIQSFAQEINPSTQVLIARFHDLAQRAYAKRSKRDLGSEGDDLPLESEQDLKALPSDDEDDEEEDDVGDAAAATERLRLTILAERRFCELSGKLVLAIVGRVLDASGSQRGKLRQKLLRNKARLGTNYKEVVSYLEERKSHRSVIAPSDKQTLIENGISKDAECKGTGNIADKENDNDEAEPMSDIEEDEEEDLRARGLVNDEAAVDGEDEELPIADEVEDDVIGD